MRIWANTDPGNGPVTSIHVPSAVNCSFLFIKDISFTVMNANGNIITEHIRNKSTNTILPTVSQGKDNSYDPIL